MLKDTKSIPLAGVYLSPVSVAGTHGQAEPAFCRYRQGKLVIYTVYAYLPYLTLDNFTDVVEYNSRHHRHFLCRRHRPSYFDQTLCKQNP